MSFEINNLKALKEKKQLNNVLKGFVEFYVEANAAECVDLFGFECKQNKTRDAYNVVAKVNTSRQYSLPVITYKMLVADRLCFVSENGGEPKNVSEIWNKYCLSELSGEVPKSKIKRKIS